MAKGLNALWSVLSTRSLRSLHLSFLVAIKYRLEKKNLTFH